MRKAKLRLLYSKIPSISKSKFEIKSGYKHRKGVGHFDDLANTDEYQDEVYSFALEIFKHNGLNTIIDIGCGSAYKLNKYFSEFDPIGVEIEPTLSTLRGKYPSLTFTSLEHSYGKTYDLVICSDVIEHVEDPTQFLNQILQLDFEYLVVSTPERNAVRGLTDYGPPGNIYHFREWSYDEFNSYISKFVNIQKHYVTKDGDNTQIVLAKKIK